MIRPLLVAVAHGLDLLTFVMAVAVFGIGGEANVLMRAADAQFGLVGVVALKGSGAAALSLLTALRPWMLLLAAGAGIAGAIVNLAAITV